MDDHPVLMNCRYFTTLYTAMSRKNVAGAAFAATSVLTLALWKIDGELTGGTGGSSLNLQLAFSMERFETILASWRPGGLDLFLGTIWINFLYALSYAVLLASAPLYFSKRGAQADPASVTAKDLLFFLTPVGAGVCDWIVHALLIVVFSWRPAGDALIYVISSAAALKWLLILISFALLLRSYFAARKEMKGRTNAPSQ